ncbi:MAG: hypothetical protein ACK5DV_10175 [Planctomycetota bacterium]
MITMDGFRRKGLLIGSALMLMLIPQTICSVARAEATASIDELRSMSITVAKKVARHLQEKQKGIQVKIGAFTSIPADGANTGGLLANEFKMAFGSAANNASKIVVFGTYKSEQFQDKDGVAKTRVKVTVRLLDESTGRELAEFNPVEFTLANAANTAQIQGVTAVVPDSGALPVNNKNVPFIGGTQIKAFQDSPYAIEILKRKVKTNDRLNTIEPELVKGQPFVPLLKGEVVQIRVLNYSSKEIGISMKLDGVDQFALSKVTKPLLDHENNQLFDMKNGKPLLGPRYRAFIVDPSKNGVPGETILTGWHKTNKISEEFELVGLGKGVRSLFPELVDGPVGVISVGISNTQISTNKAPMAKLPASKLPPEPNFQIKPAESYPRNAPRAGSSQYGGTRWPRRIPQNKAMGSAGSSSPSPPAAGSRSPQPTAPKSPATPQQSKPSSEPEDIPEIGIGDKFENQVTGVDRIIEDPNTIITVRYHR